MKSNLSYWRSYGRVAKRIFPYFRPVDNPFILDVGAGCCHGLDFLGGEFDSKNLYYIEVERCKEYNFKHISFDACDGWGNAHRNKFHIIIARQSLEHMANPRKALINCYKALKKDGVLYISVPDMRFVGDEVFSEVHYHYFSRGILKRMLKHIGFYVNGAFINFTDLSDLFFVCTK